MKIQNYNLYSSLLLHQKCNKKIDNKNAQEQKLSTTITPNNYIISGTCEEENDFFIYINNFLEDGKINIGKRYIAKVKDGKFECKLEILPTFLDYMLIQNPERYPENVIIPKITSIKMCDTKYVKNIESIYDMLKEYKISIL